MSKYSCKYTESLELSLYSPEWQHANVAMIDQYPWRSAARPYSPEAQARMLWNEKGLFLRFEIWEQNIRATYTEPNAPVCRDSCVEFFFCPDAADARYLSFEINPLGALLIGLGTGGNDIVYLEDDRRIFNVQVVCEKDYWRVSYAIPFEFIGRYFLKTANRLRGNFMKCADLSPTPHHGCWSLIETEIPIFHKPEFFGGILLEEPGKREG